MKRMDLFKRTRAGVRDYRRARPAWHKKSVSEWLLVLMQVNTSALLQGYWGQQQERESYFHKMLSIAVLCQDDNGVATPGRYAPLERLVLPDDSNLDIVMLAVDRGCAKWIGKSATDLVVLINYHLSRAIESQPTDGNIAYTLEEIRDIASLATLGLETKFNGDYDAKAN